MEPGGWSLAEEEEGGQVRGGRSPAEGREGERQQSLVGCAGSGVGGSDLLGLQRGTGWAVQSAGVVFSPSGAVPAAGVMPTFQFLPFAALLGTLGFLCVVFTGFWSHHWRGGFAWDGSAKMFNWHPVFMVTGMLVLYGAGKWVLSLGGVSGAGTWIQELL